MSISVVMASYNGAKYIGYQIESILCQLSPDDELIISDDDSTDATLEIISSFDDKRIHVVHNHGPQGVVNNFENGLNFAKGQYIFLSDQDDVWCEDKTSKILPYFQKGYDCVVHDAYITGETIDSVKGTFFEKRIRKIGFIRNLVKNPYVGCCMAFDRKILEKALPFPKGIPMHDSWIGMVAEKFYSVMFLDEPLVYYRRHGENASPTTGRSNQPLQKKLMDRYFLLKGLLQRGKL